MVRGRLFQAVMFAVIMGLIYLQIDDHQSGIQDRKGALFFLAVNGFMSSTMGVLSIFATEKAVFRREYDSGFYKLPAYFLSRTLVELPWKLFFPALGTTIVYWMIGFQATANTFFTAVVIIILGELAGTALGIFVAAIFDDIAVALAVIPVFIMPLMIFSGFMVNTASLPVWLQWVPYISPIKYAFTGLVKNEFEGMDFYCTSSEYRAGPNNTMICPTTTGHQVVNQLGFASDGSIAVQIIVMAGLYIFLNVLGYLALRRQLKKTN